MHLNLMRTAYEAENLFPLLMHSLEFTAKPGYLFFFFYDTATTDIYTLALHDALPIWLRLKPMAQPEPAKSRCLASLRSSASDHARPSAAFSALSRSFSCQSAS